MILRLIGTKIDLSQESVGVEVRVATCLDHVGRVSLGAMCSRRGQLEGNHGGPGAAKGAGFNVVLWRSCAGVARTHMIVQLEAL